MPLDPATGVWFEVHGPAAAVAPSLLIGLPLMASFTAIFGESVRSVLDGYLERLTDRYRVLLVDYPSIGKSRDIRPEALTAERVCADLLGVASAAGFERFAYWGHSWGGAVGLQLAIRTDRLTALVVGGWPPSDAPYAPLLEATKLKQSDPEESSLKVLRSKDQYRQWQTFYDSVLEDRRTLSAARVDCPAMAVYGATGDLVEAGVPVPIASTVRATRPALEAQGWRVHEIAGEGHGVCMRPDLIVPPVRDFLDEVVT